MKNPTITLLLPILNEIDGLRAILCQLDTSLFDQVLIIDANSTDGSWQYAMEQGVPIVNQIRKGLGNALYDIVGMLDTDYAVEFSLDGNCIAKDLPKLVAKIHEGYDVVQMSRYLPPAKSEDDNIITAFGNWMFTKAIRYLGKFPATDSLNIYHGYKCSIIDYPEFGKFVDGQTFDPLVMAVGNYRGLKMVEIPSSEPRRIGGEAKMRVIYNGSCILLMIIRMYLLKFKIIRA